jgi:hypothetical protein
MTKIEAFSVLFDTALLFTLSIMLVANVIIIFRKQAVLLALLYRRSVIVIFDIRRERLTSWLAAQMLELALFMLCLLVWAQRMLNMADAVEVRMLNGGKFKLTLLRDGQVDERELGRLGSGLR